MSTGSQKETHCRVCQKELKKRRFYTNYRKYCSEECQREGKLAYNRERIEKLKSIEKPKQIAFGTQEPEVELNPDKSKDKLYALKFIDFAEEFETSAEKTTINAIAKQAISRHAREFKINYSLVNQKVAVTEKDPITGQIRQGERRYALFSISQKRMYEIFCCVRKRYSNAPSYTHKQSMDSFRKLYNIFVKHINNSN